MTANNLFIEDAIEETQVLTSGVSAEYGRFSGGVINTITKSGSNMFSGGFRTNLYKPDWTGRTPFEVESDTERTGTLGNNTTYETTVGGPIVHDRLWFFWANRIRRQAETRTFDETGLTYDDDDSNDRNLFKFTGTVAQGHTLEGSYMRNSTEQAGPSFTFTVDPAGLRTRQVPNDLFVTTYRGAVTPKLFAELQMSRREFGFRNSGGTATDIVDSPMITRTQALGHFNAPYFDANDPQNRNNLQFTGSLTYFADSPTLGTHSVKGGFEHFTSTLQGGNSQSATGYVFVADYAVDAVGTRALDADGRLLPVFTPGSTLGIGYPAQRGATLDVRTLSFYVNDNWQFGDHLSFNIGLRSERVDSAATGGIVGLDTSAVVPRLAAAYDPIGDGRYSIQATYGHYAGKYNEAQFNRNTGVGNPDEIVMVYLGPEGQGRNFAPGFELDNYLTVAGTFPTRNVFFEDGLKSPITKEFTLGGGVAVGRRGYGKVTYIHRSASNFVENYFDLAGGTTTVIEDGQDFGTFTNQIIANTDMLSRGYDALEFLGRYQVTNQFMLDASVTVQINNDGNFAGEDANRPAISSPAFDYPEITPENRYYPIGRLDGFQKLKSRVWGIYNLGLGEAGTIDIGGVWRYDSGRVYSLRAENVGVNATQRALLRSLGYVDEPQSVLRHVYFDAGRGSETFPGYGLFDLSVQYSIPVWESLNPWFKAEIYNLSNNSKQIGANTTVTLDQAGPVDDLGIPKDYVAGARFGEPTSVDHYPQYLPNLDGLRTFRMALGFRF